MSKPLVRTAAAAFTLFAAAVVYVNAADPSLASQANSVVSVNGSPEGAEGGVGFTNFSFNLSRSGDLTMPCTVFYETADVTAFAPEDYAATSGSVTIGAGNATALVPVQVFGEFFLEDDETFQLRLTGTGANCSLGPNATGTAVIVNEETPPPPGQFFFGIEGDIAGGPSGLPDAAIRANDIVKLRRIILGLDTVTPMDFQKADINSNCGDGQVNSGDIALLRQWLLTGIGQILNCGPSGPIQQIAEDVDRADDVSSGNVLPWQR